MRIGRLSGRGLCAGAGAALAVLAGAALPGHAGAASAAPAASAAVTLSAAPLGVDIAPWDSILTNSATKTSVQQALEAAGVGQLHYGNGITTDLYN